MTTGTREFQVSCSLWCQHKRVAQVLALPRQRSLDVQLLPARGPWVWRLSPGRVLTHGPHISWEAGWNTDTFQVL